MTTICKNLNSSFLVFIGTSLVFLLVQAEPGAAQVKGTATFRERMALAPDADKPYPVLTRGNGNDVQVTLRMVAASKPPSKSAQASPLGTLPASFIGELPCADCPGIRYHVNLFPDRVFFLRT